MMCAYTIQVILTILTGPAYRTLYLVLSPSESNSFVEKLKKVQTVFSASNGFFVLAGAVASIARLSQNPPMFEIAQMQAMAFLHINGILVMFFCLVRPMSHRITRSVLYTVVFIFVLVVLGMSQLSGSWRSNWRLASDGCAQQSTDFDVITPVWYPWWAGIILTIGGMAGFWLQSLKSKFQDSQAHMVLFKVLMSAWALLIGLLIAGMATGLAMMWRQRNHLHSVAGADFEDDDWGFGQIAALFIWAPIPVEILFVLDGEHPLPLIAAVRTSSCLCASFRSYSFNRGQESKPKWSDDRDWCGSSKGMCAVTRRKRLIWRSLITVAIGHDLSQIKPSFQP